MGGVRIVAGDPMLAGWLVYGSGTPGTHGTPTLLLDVDPVLGQPFTLIGTSSAAGNAAGICVLGFNPVSQPMPWGGTLLAAPNILSPLTVPPTGFSVPLRFGPDPQLFGLQLFGQLFVAAAGATGGVAGGVAGSAGLRATFGR